MKANKENLWKFIMGQSLTKFENGGGCSTCGAIKKYEAAGNVSYGTGVPEGITIGVNASSVPQNMPQILNRTLPATSPTIDPYVANNYEFVLQGPYAKHGSGYGSYTTDFEKMLYAKGALGMNRQVARMPIYNNNNTIANFGQYHTNETPTGYGNAEVGITGRYLPATGSPITFKNSQAGIGAEFGALGEYNTADGQGDMGYAGPRIHLHPEIGFQPTFIEQSPMGIRKQIHTSPFYGFVNADYTHNIDLMGQGVTNQDFINTGRNQFTLGAGARYTFPGGNDYFQNPFIQGSANYNVYTKQPQYQIGVGTGI